MNLEEYKSYLEKLRDGAFKGLVVAIDHQDEPTANYYEGRRDVLDESINLLNLVK